MTEITGFIAYPACPSEIGQTLERTISNIALRPGIDAFQTWREMDIPGRFIAERVLEFIDGKECLIADITTFWFS